MLKAFTTISCLLFVSIALFAQGSDVPYGNDTYDMLTRLELKTDIEPPFFSFDKPLSRATATAYALAVDSTQRTTLDSHDRADLYYIFHDNNLFLDSTPKASAENSRYTLSKHAWFNTFYKTPANFFEINVPHFALNVNPMLDLQFGDEQNTNRVLYDNMRGIRIQGAVDDKVWFSTNFFEQQQRFPNYVTEQIGRREAIPGAGYFKTYNSRFLNIGDDYDYLNAEGYLGVQATKHIQVHFGHGSSFLGDGYRSMFLSNTSNNFFFLKLNTRVWKFEYQNLFAELTREYHGIRNDNLLPKKYMAMHHLAYHPVRNLTVGVMEAVVFDRNGSFELQYLNPVIFYRTVEQMVGSPDNTLIGIDAKYNFGHHFQVYGQWLLDEFNFNELFIKRRGYWANKYGVQLGMKYIDIANVSHLDGLLEYNAATPYTYTHRSSEADFTNYNQPLAHPLGANFSEVVAQLKYAPTPRIALTARAIYAKAGRDSVGATAPANWGGDIFQPYTTHPNEFGNSIGQGATSYITNLHLQASYQLRHNLFIDLTLHRRTETNATWNYWNSSSTYVGLGLRLNAWHRTEEF